MEIRNLITFVSVAELNSFTKAARALDYSQSTISFQIRQLEEELGCLLFERINHTISLTDRGRELLIYAKQVRRMSEEFHRSVSGESEARGLLHVVAPDSLCEDMMTRDYTDFYRSYPGISLKFTTADTVDMFRMLDHNEADLVLSLDSHIYRNDYVIAKEERIPMHFVTGASSECACAKQLSVRDVAGQPFILTEKGMGYRRVFDDALAKLSLEIEPVLEIGRTDIITSVLEAGIGISYLPDFVTHGKVRQGKLAYLDVPDFETDIWKQLIHHKNKWISKSLEVLIEYIKEREFGKAEA